MPIRGDLNANDRNGSTAVIHVGDTQPQIFAAGRAAADRRG